MATITREIKCINKTNRQSIHERISNIGGVNGDGGRWKMTQSEAIRGINNKTLAFYVTKNSKTVKVEVAESQYGNEYLRTESDTTETNNLLSLPECP